MISGARSQMSLRRCKVALRTSQIIQQISTNKQKAGKTTIAAWEEHEFFCNFSSSAKGKIRFCQLAIQTNLRDANNFSVARVCTLNFTCRKISEPKNKNISLLLARLKILRGFRSFLCALISNQCCVCCWFYSLMNIKSLSLSIHAN